MSSPIAKAVFLVFLAGSASAQNSNSGQVAMPGADPAMCDALANAPNSPMTVEACRAMLTLTQDDPAAHRPGDESMTCADIFDELQAATADMHISVEEVRRRQKTLDDTQTLNERHGTKAAAALAPNAAAMQTLGAIAPFVPSAVIEPAVAAQQAQIQAKGKIAGDAYSAEARKLTGESADIAASTLSDPRTRRLSQLAVQKDCNAPTR
ncbi:MAG: hypothetical protein ABI650_11465 [Dokdonella sp.]